MFLRFFVLAISLLLFITGCSEYSKILKSNDFNLKYEAANKYYEEGDYYKAYALFDELMTIYNGTTRAEEMYFKMAYCDYNLGFYSLSATRFNIFYKRYPLSENAEEALFLSALSNYKNSPVHSLDQTDTYRAINNLQLFINKYPESNRVDTCNTLVEKLRDKLEKKYYDMAYLYHHMDRHKAAVIAFNNLLEDFPDTDYKEKALFYQLKSQYLLAYNSIESKKRKRYEDVKDSYIKFVDYFPSSSFIKQAEGFYEQTTKALTKNE